MPDPTILPLEARSAEAVLRVLFPALGVKWNSIHIEGSQIAVDWNPQSDSDRIDPPDHRSTYEMVREDVHVIELQQDGRPFAFQLLRAFLLLETRQTFPSYVACSANARRRLRKLTGFPPMVPFHTMLGARFVESELPDHTAVVLGVPGIGYPLTAARLGVRLDLD